MRISKLIERLEEAKREHGDVACVVEVYTTTGSGVANLEVDGLSVENRCYREPNGRETVRSCLKLIC